MVQAVRVVRHRGGVVEVVRVLSEPVLCHWQPDDPLAYEATIVWLFAPESLDFARVLWLRDAHSRSSPIRLAGPKITLGYSTLTSDAPRHPQTGCYARRVFYLLYDDLYRNLIDLPQGAVSPEHLLPGQQGIPPDPAAILPAYPRSIGQRLAHKPAPAGPPAVWDSSQQSAGQPIATAIG